MATPGFMSFDSLVEDIAPNVRQCPDYTVLAQVKNAAIEVCEKTHLWRWVHPRISLTQGVHEYAFQPPANAQIAKVLSATLIEVPDEPEEETNTGQELHGVQYTDLTLGRVPDIPKGWPYAGQQGTCLLYTSPSPRD